MFVQESHNVNTSYIANYAVQRIFQLFGLLVQIKLLYGLPKIHKEGTPCRPILASYDSFAYECAVWLSEFLTPLREHSSNIKNTCDFVTRILSSKPGPNHMVSFDVKSLFTNIPIDFVIDQILEKSIPDKKALFHGLTTLNLKNY